MLIRMKNTAAPPLFASVVKNVSPWLHGES